MKILKFTISLCLCFSSLILFAQVEDLIHHYKFDGNLDDAAADSNGVFVPGVGSSTTEPIYMEGFDGTADGAILFPAAAQEYYMVTVGTWSPSQLGTPNEMTVAFWAYWNGSTGEWQDIINKRDNWSDNEMAWGINQHHATGSIISVRTNKADADSQDSIPKEDWTHVAIAMDNVNAYFYKDGEYYQELPFVYNTGFDAMINLGTSNNGEGPRANDVYNGALDDVRFYSRVLDADEVMKIYDGEADISGIEDKVGYRFELAQNYPNPFNLTTQISYTLERGTNVEIDVYNVHGQKIAALVNQHQWAGTHKVVWDATNASAGVYFYKMKVDNHIVSKRMLLVK